MSFNVLNDLKWLSPKEFHNAEERRNYWWALLNGARVVYSTISLCCLDDSHRGPHRNDRYKGINQKSRIESEFGAIIAIVVVAMVLKPRKYLFNTLTLLQNYWYTDMEYHQTILSLTRKITNNWYTDKENHQTILSLTRKITKQYCHWQGISPNNIYFGDQRRDHLSPNHISGAYPELVQCWFRSAVDSTIRVHCWRWIYIIQWKYLQWVQT